MRAEDFFFDVEVFDNSLEMNGDPWTDRAVERHFDVESLEALRRAPVAGRTDLEVALALVDLVQEQLERYGTDGSQTLSDDEIGLAIKALHAVGRRVAVDVDLPFRNFSTFRSYWTRNDGHGSWQARRDMLETLFEPLHRRLLRLEELSLEALSTPISPRAEVGWPVVDQEIRELRRHFAAATTPQDYRGIGTNCVGVLESLGAAVYDPATHLREGEKVPPRDKTNMRIGRYIEDALPGPRNEDLRGLANKAAALAHHVKHSPTPTRREAGISADAVILLANMLRRLHQDL